MGPLFHTCDMFHRKLLLFHQLEILTFLISLNASVREPLLVDEAWCGKTSEYCAGVRDLIVVNNIGIICWLSVKISHVPFWGVPNLLL